jgi:hypothetical protein
VSKRAIAGGVAGGVVGLVVIVFFLMRGRDRSEPDTAGTGEDLIPPHSTSGGRATPALQYQDQFTPKQGVS